MTDMGQLKYFLGIEIEQDFKIETLTMRQTKFASDILTKFNMENSKPGQDASGSRSQADQVHV